MSELDLQQLRREKWRLTGQPLQTIEEAHAFIDSVGFCLMYPERQPVLVPTFIGAFVGSEDRLPTAQRAFTDPRAQQAIDLMVRLLRQKAAFEARLFGDNIFLVSASVFPYFYGLVGDRDPRHMPTSTGRTGYSPMAQDVHELIRKHGPVSKAKLREILGGTSSDSALDRSLGELWARLRITRVDYNQDEGAFWDVLYRWAPEAVREGVQVSMPEALSALVSKYLDCVVAAEPSEVADFFGHLVPRSKVNDAVKALLAARELSFVAIDNKSHVQVTPPRSASLPVRQTARVVRRKPEPKA